jgi:hypothetical protein
MFGGILTVLPDFDDFTIYRFTLPTGDACVIPVGQHTRTNDTVVCVPVLNHALEVLVETKPNDPNAVDEKTLKTAGEFGEFLVGGRNIGAPDAFRNFSLALSNTIEPGRSSSASTPTTSRREQRRGRLRAGGPAEGGPRHDHDGVADEDPPDD